MNFLMGIWMRSSTLVGLGLEFRVVGAGVGVQRFGVVEVQMQGFCWCGTSGWVYTASV